MVCCSACLDEIPFREIYSQDEDLCVGIEVSKRFEMTIASQKINSTHHFVCSHRTSPVVRIE